MSLLNQARVELALTSPVPDVTGNSPEDNKRVQEWLCLHNFQCNIDGIVGPATIAQIAAFQKSKKLRANGIVDNTTFRYLTGPMRDALRINTGASPLSYRQCIVTVAKQHLAEHAREIGGQNRGPWVRLYTQGNEGNMWAWCGGFVSFVFEQAAAMRRSFLFGEDLKSPLEYTLSCDSLALQGKKKLGERLDFISKREEKAADLIRPGDIFLNRRTDIDWTHTGIVTSVQKDYFRTIEGNSNDNGSREGYEVCTQVRSYHNRDFVTYDGFDKPIPQPVDPLPNPISKT